MFQCPDCAEVLARTASPAGLLWRCGRCQGVAVTLPVLRRIVAEPAIRMLWTRAMDATAQQRPCPSCRAPMREVAVTSDDGPLQLEVCRACTLVWFDRQELDALPRAPVEQARPAAEDPRVEAARARRRASVREDDELSRPRYLWTWLGLPVEVGERTSARPPWATRIVALVVVATSVAAWCWPALMLAFAFVPGDAWRNGGVTWLLSFCLHAGVFHLLGNLYFFLVFADNVEDDVGPARLLLLLAAATIVGNALHWLGDPRAMVPCVGASGGIAGVLAYYALRFPQAQLVTRFRVFLYFPVVRFRAVVGFAVWVGLQLLGAIVQLRGASSVSSLAHLGGAVAGVGAFLLWRELDARRAAGPPPRHKFDWR